MNKEINFNKLPKNVKEYIKNIERQRDTAIQKLNEYLDDQTKSDVYTTDLACLGEERGPSLKTRYIQTSWVYFERAGVILSVILRDNCIDLQWSGIRGFSTPVCFTPYSYQGARIMGKEYM